MLFSDHTDPVLSNAFLLPLSLSLSLSHPITLNVRLLQKPLPIKTKHILIINRTEKRGHQKRKSQSKKAKKKE